MKKSIFIYILITLNFFGCAFDSVDRMLPGMWSISYIDNGVAQENVVSCLDGNVILFNNDGTCQLPILQRNCSDSNFVYKSMPPESIEWSTEKKDGCYYITFHSSQNSFKGPLHLAFNKDTENKLLQMHAFSDSVYFTASKMLLNYDLSAYEINNVVSKTSDDCSTLH